MNTSLNTSSAASRGASNRLTARHLAGQLSASPSSRDGISPLFVRFPAEPAFAATWNSSLLDNLREPLTRYHE